MSFGLKNAGATYQHAIQLCFADQLHRNVEAYVDDIVFKTKTQDQFITDLEENFNSLQKFRWKLNPTKCVFGVPLENYSDSSSVTEELRLIQRRSMAMDTPATIMDV